MSTRKRTIEELERAIKAQEERVKKLRAEKAERTRAEEARLNADIIKAIDEWRMTLPADRRHNRADLPKWFRKQAEENRARYGVSTSAIPSERTEGVQGAESPANEP